MTDPTNFSSQTPSFASLCQRAPKYSHPGQGEMQPFLRSEIRCSRFFTKSFCGEPRHGEPTQDGESRRNSTTCCAALVWAPHRPRTGNRPGHGGTTLGAFQVSKRLIKCSHSARRLRTSKCSHFFTLPGSRG